jgi:hypothetical protein
MLRAWSSAILVSLSVGVGAMAAAGAQAEQPLRFDAETALKLDPGGARETTLLNDSGESYSITVEAALDPPGTQGGAGVPVPVQVDVGAGFAPSSATTTLSAAGRMRVRLSAPANARPGATGWLTVVARSAGQVVVVRRPLSVARPAPTVASWSTASRQWLPLRDSGGELEPLLPLLPKRGCATLGAPATVLVSGDRTVSVTSSCESGNLRLSAGDFAPGTYKGKLEVGAETVELEIRRTMSIFWPTLMIVLGVLAAIVTQGRRDRGWFSQQQRWLRRLPKKAAKADVLYDQGAADLPIGNYVLEPLIDDEVVALRRRSDSVAEERPWVLRWLPWPAEFMASEREAIRARIAELDELVRIWPTMPAVFQAAHARMNEQAYYATRAPQLVKRTFVIVGAAGLPIDASELAARCSEAAALPQALEVIDDLELLDAYLHRLENHPDGKLSAQDRRVLLRARQYERQASACLAELTDATHVAMLVGRPAEHAARLASRLPKPAEPSDETDHEERDDVTEESVEVHIPGELPPVSLPLDVFRRVAALLGHGTAPAAEAALILLTLFVGVVSGLAVLYVGKAWGGSWTDYAAAFVWGYAASTVIDPIVSSIRQFGSHAGDAAAAA